MNSHQFALDAPSLTPLFMIQHTPFYFPDVAMLLKRFSDETRNYGYNMHDEEVLLSKLILTN